MAQKYLYNQPLVIGIDPGANTGVARWEFETPSMLDIRELEFWTTIFFLQQHNPATTLVICEDPNQNTPVFGAERVLAQSGARGLASRGQSVGRNKEHARLICKWLHLMGYAHIKKRPGKNKIPKQLKNKNGKVSQKGFEQLTGLNWKCTHNERDAGLMVDQFPKIVYLAHMENR